MAKKRLAKIRSFLKAQATLRSWLGWGGKSYGFYIPYEYSARLKLPDQDDCLDWLKEAFDRQLSVYLAFVDEAAQFNDRFHEFRTEDPENAHRPRFDQDWFPGLDGAMAYTMVRRFEPKRIVEIGSGHSTRFLRQAICDGNLKTHLHAVDPAPRRGVEHICDQFTRSTVDRVPIESLLSLVENDILFIDGSHIAMPGTDVDWLFSRILPQLATGVLIHIHDIFLPNGYPNAWKRRWYNEQNFLLAMIAGGERYRILFPGAYMRRYHGDIIDQRLFSQCRAGAHEASFWIQVRNRSAACLMRPM
jgi:hypothetical protein